MTAAPRTFVLERTFDAPLEDVWELWTTKDGIESWWGPPGFGVEVHEIDVRVGGMLLYSMIARAPEMLAFMKRNGMPPRTESRVTYTEVVPLRRLAYVHPVDFVPGVAPYDIAMLVELFTGAAGVRMVLTSDVMHDDVWTERARAGWDMELEKLRSALKARR